MATTPPELDFVDPFGAKQNFDHLGRRRQDEFARMMASLPELGAERRVPDKRGRPARPAPTSAMPFLRELDVPDLGQSARMTAPARKGTRNLRPSCDRYAEVGGSKSADASLASQSRWPRRRRRPSGSRCARASLASRSLSVDVVNADEAVVRCRCCNAEMRLSVARAPNSDQELGCVNFCNR